MALRKKHEVLEEPQDYEIERRETTRYTPDPEAGLSTAQVEEHRADGWSNVSVAPPAQTTKEIIRENVCTYFNLIFLVLAILLCLVGSFRAGDSCEKCTGKAEYAKCSACQCCA